MRGKLSPVCPPARKCANVKLWNCANVEIWNCGIVAAKIFAINIEMFGFETANNSAICFWLSQMRPSRDMSENCDFPSSVV